MNDEEILDSWGQKHGLQKVYGCRLRVECLELMALARADERENGYNKFCKDADKLREQLGIVPCSKHPTVRVFRCRECDNIRYQEAFEKGKLQGREEERDKMVLQECPKCKTRITNNKAFDRVSELEKQVAELKVLNDQLTDANRDHNKENAKLREALLSAEAATRTLRGALEKIAKYKISRHVMRAAGGRKTSASIMIEIAKKALGDVK
jgi:hypothetical protein